MSKNETETMQPASAPSDADIRAIYGAGARISRVGEFALVHLDRPSKALIARRTRNFKPDEFFFDDCPLCRLAKAGGIIVYDNPDETRRPK